MDEIKSITEYINTTLGASGLAAAAFAGNWVRKNVKRYMEYIDARMAALGDKANSVAPPPITEKEIEAMIIRALRTYQRLENARRENAGIKAG